MIRPSQGPTNDHSLGLQANYVNAVLQMYSCFHCSKRPPLGKTGKTTVLTTQVLCETRLLPCFSILKWCKTHNIIKVFQVDKTIAKVTKLDRILHCIVHSFTTSCLCSIYTVFYCSSRLHIWPGPKIDVEKFTIEKKLCVNLLLMTELVLEINLHPTFFLNCSESMSHVETIT